MNKKIIPKRKQFKAVGIASPDYERIKKYCEKHSLKIGSWLAQLALNYIKMYDASKEVESKWIEGRSLGSKYMIPEDYSTNYPAHASDDKNKERI